MPREETSQLTPKAQKDLMAKNGITKSLRAEFARTGPAIALDATRDGLVDAKVALCWEEAGICEIGGLSARLPEWWARFIAPTGAGRAKKARNVTGLIQSLENPHDDDRVGDPLTREIWEGLNDEVARAAAD